MKVSQQIVITISQKRTPGQQKILELSSDTRVARFFHSFVFKGAGFLPPFTTYSQRPIHSYLIRAGLGGWAVL
jgi:hypothetical protein